MSIQLRAEIERKLRNHEFTCEKELTMSIISGKYKIVIIWHLGNEGPHRYGKLFNLFPGISNRILTKQLRELEQDGIVSRTIYPVVPPKVEYFLTEMGKTILPIVNDMFRWGKENMRYYYEKLLEKDKKLQEKKQEHNFTGVIRTAVPARSPVATPGGRTPEATSPVKTETLFNLRKNPLLRIKAP